MDRYRFFRLADMRLCAAVARSQLPAGRLHGFRNCGTSTLPIHAVLASPIFEAAGRRSGTGAALGILGSLPTVLHKLCRRAAWRCLRQLRGCARRLIATACKIFSSGMSAPQDPSDERRAGAPRQNGA
jgi:hypothetical protein